MSVVKKTAPTWEKDGYLLRLARREDADAYFSQNYDPLDPEVARFTGCKAHFTREEVISFFLGCLEAEDRYDFLILSPEGKIIGESVINEIDPQLRCADFRIALFQREHRGRGIGSWAVRTTRDFAFGTLGLHRLSLDVFSFNPRAERAYLAAGFRREGVLRDAVRDGEGYGDDILMALLEEEWRTLPDRQPS